MENLPDVPREWQSAIGSICDRPSNVVMLLGGPDTGKTTFALCLAREIVTHVGTAAIVDADVGQSTFGPPTTVGLALASRPWVGVSDLEVAGMYFAGDNSPRGHLLEVVVGTKRLTDRAIARGVKHIVIDTSGMISHPLGEILKYRKIELVRPTSLVALQFEAELEPILNSVRGLRSMAVYRLRVPSAVRSHSRDERIERRRQGYRRYFRNAHAIEIPPKDVALFPAHIDLRDPALAGVLAALLDRAQEVAGLGIYRGFNAGRAAMEFTTPVPAEAEVRGLAFGVLRVSVDGEELGRIGPAVG